MIISVDAGKAFDKIQKLSIKFSVDAGKAFDKIQPIYDKNSPKSGHRGNLPQHNKGHIGQTHSKHHSQW